MTLRKDSTMASNPGIRGGGLISMGDKLMVAAGDYKEGTKKQVYHYSGENRQAIMRCLQQEALKVHVMIRKETWGSFKNIFWFGLKRVPYDLDSLVC